MRVTLSSVSVVFTDGDWIESKDQSPTGIRLIQTGNVGIGEFKDRGEKARYISAETFKRLRCEEIYEGDCLISRLPDPVGRACIIPAVKERLITAVDCTIIRFDTSKIYPDYFRYFSQSATYLADIESACTGATRKRISRNKLGDIKLPLPPLSEQKRIVAILDEVFEGVEAAGASAEKNLANARELFESYLNSVFCEKGVERAEKQFFEICDITSRLVDPREPEFIDLLHIGAGNMVSLTGEVIDVKTAREESLKSGKFLFDKTMVLYSKIRPYLMKACRPDFSGLCSADVYPLLPDPQHLERDFLFYMLMSREFTAYAIAGSDRAGMPKVNRDHLFRYKTWLPPVAEQRQLASKLDAISGECRRLEATYLLKLAALKELRQVILYKAFAGELTARDREAVQEAAE